MKARFVSAANRDIHRILEYYSDEAGADVAADFCDELEFIIDSIKRSPNSYPLIDDERRRILFQRFPFQIIYRVESTEFVRIIAVRHHKQHPDFGLDR